jgi:error-prone DNA polymerase
VQGDQLALPLDGAPAPDLPELEPWERMVADYRSTGITIGTHAMEMLRAELDPAVLTSSAIGRTRDGTPVTVAGMVVARQRPATAKGIVFMLLEDEHGVINLIVPPPVVERHRLAVRTSGFVVASGKLEHREGTTNVLVGKIERLERTGVPAAEVREIEPSVERETGREVRPAHEQAVSELAAALPAPHSFGRRGR